MNKEETLVKLDEAIQWLYQNKEKKALLRVAELLDFYQNIAEKLADRNDDRVLYAMEFIKTLMENYNRMDMFGIADCLKESAYHLIDIYEKD